MMIYSFQLVFLVSAFIFFHNINSWKLKKFVDTKNTKFISAALSSITLATVISSASVHVKADDTNHHHHHIHHHQLQQQQQQQLATSTFSLSDNVDPMSSFTLVQGIIIKELQEPPSEIVRDAIDALKDASIPANFGSLLALSAAEALSGAVGALSSRRVATLLKDKKKDSNSVKALGAGLFFGSRSIIRTSCRLIGLPRSLSIIVAAVVASLISEALKVGSRLQKAKTLTKSRPLSIESSKPITEYIDSEEKQVISVKEIGSDVSKWLIYDGLSEATRVPFLSDSNNPLLLPLVYTLNGGISSLISSFVKITGNDKISNQNRLKEVIEGAILFLCYEEFQEILLYLGKGTFLDQKFMFDEVIEKIEDIVEEDIEYVERDIQSSSKNWFMRK